MRLPSADPGGSEPSTPQCCPCAVQPGDRPESLRWPPGRPGPSRPKALLSSPAEDLVVGPPQGGSLGGGRGSGSAPSPLPASAVPKHPASGRVSGRPGDVSLSPSLTSASLAPTASAPEPPALGPPSGCADVTVRLCPRASLRRLQSTCSLWGREAAGLSQGLAAGRAVPPDSHPSRAGGSGAGILPATPLHPAAALGPSSPLRGREAARPAPRSHRHPARPPGRPTASSLRFQLPRAGLVLGQQEALKQGSSAPWPAGAPSSLTVRPTRGHQPAPSTACAPQSLGPGAQGRVGRAGAGPQRPFPEAGGFTRTAASGARVEDPGTWVPGPHLEGSHGPLGTPVHVKPDCGKTQMRSALLSAFPRGRSAARSAFVLLCSRPAEPSHPPRARP